MQKFLELRCPGLPKKKALKCDGHTECGRELAGPSISTIEACLSVGPYVDIRYCSSCKTMWKITIPSFQEIPRFEMTAKDEEIPFVRDTDFFDLMAVECSNSEKVE